jgi:hypothetical protein
LVAGLVEALAQFLGQEHKLHRKVLLFLLAPILRPTRRPSGRSLPRDKSISS